MARHSRSLCTQATFTLRAQRPPSCIACLHESEDTARMFTFSALAVLACDHAAGTNPSAHHSRSLCSQAAFALRAHQPPACFACLLACIRRYCSHVIFFALAVFACDHVAGVIPSDHNSRSLCSQTAFALRAHQPPACFSCLHVSDDTARTSYSPPSLFSLVIMWLVLFHRPITRAACAPRLHSH